MSVKPLLDIHVARKSFASTTVLKGKAVTEGNLVSAPAWPAHPNWLAAFLGLLGTQITL